MLRCNAALADTATILFFKLRRGYFRDEYAYLHFVPMATAFGIPGEWRTNVLFTLAGEIVCTRFTSQASRVRNRAKWKKLRPYPQRSYRWPSEPRPPPPGGAEDHGCRKEKADGAAGCDDAHGDAGM